MDTKKNRGVISILDDAIKNGISNGQHLDMIPIAYGGNFIEGLEDYSCWPIELDNIEQFKYFYDESDTNFWYISGGYFHYVAYYGNTDRFPLGRCYFVKYQNLFTAANICKQYFKGIKPWQDDQIDGFVKAKTAKERIVAYKKRFYTQQSDMVQGLFDGRKKETSTSACLYLKTEGCLVCGQPVHNYLSTTIFNGEKGVLIIFFTCDHHYKEALHEGSNTQWLFDKLSTQNLFKSDELSSYEQYEMAQQYVEPLLDCTIEKIDDVKKEITCVRNHSKFKIILRMANQLNYGYTFFDSYGNQRKRFDSAGHHNDKLKYAPDHLHCEPSVDNTIRKEK